MAERKYEKNFVISDKPNLVLPSFRPKLDPKLFRKIVHMDAEVTPGAEFYSESSWIVPGDEFKEAVTMATPHKHDWDEMIGFYGYNYDDIHSLGGEIEFTIDGETHIITKSFTSYIPAGIEHGPLIIRNVQYPIVYFVAGPTDKYK